jgi:hypothetical protein
MDGSPSCSARARAWFLALTGALTIVVSAGSSSAFGQATPCPPPPIIVVTLEPRFELKVERVIAHTDAAGKPTIMQERITILNRKEGCDVRVTSQPYGPGEKDAGPNPERRVQTVKVPPGTNEKPSETKLKFNWPVPADTGPFPFWYIDVFETGKDLPPAYPPGVGPLPEDTRPPERQAIRYSGQIDSYQSTPAPRRSPPPARVVDSYPFPYPQSAFGSSSYFALRIVRRHLPPGWRLLSMDPAPEERFWLSRIGPNSKTLRAEFQIPPDARVGQIGEVTFDVIQYVTHVRWRGTLGVVVTQG